MSENTIGADAGIIWGLLSVKGALTTIELSELIGLKESYLLLSLGWLVKENKIIVYEVAELILVELPHNTSDFYY